MYVYIPARRLQDWLFLSIQHIKSIYSYITEYMVFDWMLCMITQTHLTTQSECKYYILFTADEKVYMYSGQRRGECPSRAIALK